MQLPIPADHKEHGCRLVYRHHRPNIYTSSFTFNAVLPCIYILFSLLISVFFSCFLSQGFPQRVNMHEELSLYRCPSQHAKLTQPRCVELQGADGRDKGHSGANEGEDRCLCITFTTQFSSDIRNLTGNLLCTD